MLMVVWLAFDLVALKAVRWAVKMVVQRAERLVDGMGRLMVVNLVDLKVALTAEVKADWKEN